MINFTPKKESPSRKKHLSNKKSYTPSKLTISSIMGYAAAMKVYSTEKIGQFNILLN